MLPSIENVRCIDLPSNCDERGVLTSIEAIENIPIDIKRIFYMHHIVSDRGGHAHIDTDQVIIGIAGECTVRVSDGKSNKEYVLNDPTKGLYTPRLTFIELYGFSPGAVCLVLASTKYDIKKSLRTKQQYLEYLNNMVG